MLTRAYLVHKLPNSSILSRPIWKTTFDPCLADRGGGALFASTKLLLTVQNEVQFALIWFYSVDIVFILKVRTVTKRPQGSGRL